MDDPKLAYPPWLPWGAVACLAALLACVGELWMVERARLDLQKEENRIAGDALRSAENQLEAERIVSSREIRGLRDLPEAGFRMAALLPPDGAPTGPRGVVVWSASEPRTAHVHLAGLPVPAAGRILGLWFVGAAGGGAFSCGSVPVGPGPSLSVTLPSPIAAGSRFILADGPAAPPGGPDGAYGGGSIILASAPIAERILNP
jgi:hypothetical protein